MFMWDPKPGQLFIREMWKERNGELSLIDSYLGCIVKPRMHEKAMLQYVALLQMQFYDGVPYFSGCCTGFGELMYGREDRVNENTIVKRRSASNADIHFLLNSWDDKERTRPDKWLSLVEARCFKEEDGVLLSVEEYNRLGSITQEYMGHYLNQQFPFVPKYEFGTFGGK